MSNRFRHHDLLRLFIDIAGHGSFSDAAGALNMTKGAVSYQIKTLEADLGVPLFRRNSRGVRLTERGSRLLIVCKSHFDAIESGLLDIKGMSSRTLTVGVSTYFAARWLSPRLMSFMQDHLDIQLRIQPMIRLFDLEAQGVDVAIRWGSGRWSDVDITPFLPLPAFPVGNAAARRSVEEVGLKQTIDASTLLRDHDDSNAWTDWLDMANFPPRSRRDVLIVPDPNVRAQAVIDGQGIALMDELIGTEMKEGKLFRLSDLGLSDHGYFIAQPSRKELPETARVFVAWIRSQ